MKLASFTRDGAARFGVAVETGIRDLTGLVDGVKDLKSLLVLPDWQRKVEGVQGGPVYPLSEIEFLPVIPNADIKILALGWAYRDHLAETGKAATADPNFFTKFPQCLTGHDQPLPKPSLSETFDFEGELAVVIGKPAHRVSEAEALDYLAGYTILMDGSIREWQKHSVTAGKNWDRLTPVGPWLVTPDEADAPDAFDLVTRVNGQVMQSATTRDLIWPVSWLVSYCSTFTRLMPGDIISTGTPGGVGHKRTPPLFLQPGDLVEVEISSLGTLSNRIVAEGAA